MLRVTGHLLALTWLWGLYMPISARYLGLRLFIEGIEVPVISANVSAQIMKPASAQIQVPYSDEFIEILPRSVVHLFIYDSRHPDAERMRALYNETGTGEGTEDPSVHGKLNPTSWVLLFTGEVIGLNYLKKESARHGVIQCLDFTNYWDSAKLYFGAKSLGNKHVKQSIFMGSAVARRGKRRAKGSKQLLKILRTRPSTIPKLQGLLGGAVHLMETITGVYDPKADRQFRGVSDFYSQAELRLNLTKQLGASPHDLSSRYLTGGKEFRRIIRQLARQMRGTATYRALLNVVLKQIHHTHSPVLAPPYRAPGTKAKVLKLVRVGSRGAKNKRGKGINKELSTVQEDLTNSVMTRFRQIKGRKQPDPYHTVPGAKDQAPSVDTGGHAKWTSEHIGVFDASKSRLDNIKFEIESDQADPEVQSDSRQRATRTAQSKQEYHLREAVRILDDIATEVKTNAGEPNYPKHTEERFEAAAIALKNAGKSAKKARPRPKYKVVEREIELTDRLITTLFCPEIWMVPPPRCNVLFPDMYNNFKFGRSFLQETTRVWLYGLRRSGRINWANMYFSPNIDTINGQVGKKSAGKAASQSVSFIMPHEKFTGIIPAIQGLGNLAALRKVNKTVEKHEGGTSVTSWGIKNPAVARASNFEFFKQRFRSRNLTGSGPLNPGLVVGLPGVLMDPRVVSDPASPIDKLDVRGKHYVGLVTGIRHNIDQKGAVTSFAMGYVRAHDEGLNIFGDVKEGFVSVVKKRVRHIRKLKKPAVAEVHGFTEKKIVETGPDGKKRTVVRLVPIIGMLGQTGNVGKHITQGLSQQPGVGVKGDIASGPFAKGQTSYNDASGLRGFSNDQYGDGPGPREVGLSRSIAGDPGLDRADVTVRAEDMKRTFRVKPRKYKDKKGIAPELTSPTAENGGAIGPRNPDKIKEEVIMDHYKYSPAKSWMSPKAIGSVEVDVFRGRSGTTIVKKRRFTFSFEMIARPPWMAEIYLNQYIGDRFYNDLFGCKALTDITLVTEPPDTGKEGIELGLPKGGKSVQGTTLSEYDSFRLGALRSNRAAIEHIKAVSSIFASLVTDVDVEDRTKVQIETPDGDTFQIDSKLIGGVPIEVACAQLAEAYVFLAANDNTDMTHFTDSYTARKFATMPEIFGWGYSSPAASSGDSSKEVVGTSYVQPMTPYDVDDMFDEQPPDVAQNGFHSYAFGSYYANQTIEHQPLANAYGQGTRKVKSYVEPRGERYEAIEAYRDSIASPIGEKS